MTTHQSLQILPATDPGIFDSWAEKMALSDPWKTLGMNDKYCRLAFEGPCKEIYVAKVEDQLAGFVILQVCGTFRGYIQTIFVDEGFRGKGIGTEMLAFCEQRILEISPNIFICVSSFNTRAAKLYYELGYTLVGELTDFLKVGFNELLLRKSVGPALDYRSRSRSM